LFSFFSKKNQTKNHKKKKRKSQKEGEEIKMAPVKLKKVWKNLLESHWAIRVLFYYSEPPWSLELCSFFLIRAGICSSDESGVTNRVFQKPS